MGDDIPAVKSPISARNTLPEEDEEAAITVTELDFFSFPP